MIRQRRAHQQRDNPAFVLAVKFGNRLSSVMIELLSFNSAIRTRQASASDMGTFPYCFNKTETGAI